MTEGWSDAPVKRRSSLAVRAAHVQASAAPDPAEFAGPRVLSAPDGLTIVAATRERTADCPDCGTPSGAAHSRYERHLQDFPWQGRPVTLRIQARRLRCCNPDCRRRTFAKRLDDSAPTAARRTRRLIDLQRYLGLALGGEAGTRLATRLAIPVSADTLIRMARQLDRPSDPTPPPRVLGIDD